VISVTMVAVVMDADDAGRVADLAAAVGSCSARAWRLPALEARLQGRPLAALAGTSIDPTDLAPLSPIADVRASATYRLDATATLLRRALGALTS
jgi:CO/xanthine dehydrogenase FAD-binding subunit